MAETRPTPQVPRLVVPVLALAGVLVSLQATILVPVLSRLPEIYGVTSTAASWLVTCTTIVGAVATPIVTRMADLHGKRRVMLVALGVTVTGSLLLALSHDFGVALVGRSMQGCGTALLPVALSMVKDLLPPARVGPAVALISSTLGIGAAAGLPLAGVLYTVFGWSALFWMTALVGTVIAVVMRLMLPGAAASGRPRVSFDRLGSALLLAALLPILLVITQGNVWGWATPAVLGLLAFGSAAAGVWVLWERRSVSPLVDVRLAATRPVLLTNIASLLIGIGMFTNMLVTSLQLGSPVAAGGLGLSAGFVGLVAAAPAVAQILCAPVVGMLITRFGGRAVFLLGALWIAAAYSLRLVLGGSVVAVSGGAVLVTLGSGLTLSSLTVIIMASVPPDRTASANGVNVLCRVLGTSIASSALAAVTAVTAVTVDGLEYGSSTTHQLAYAGCAVAALLAALMMVLVPRGARAEPEPAAP